jgi:hypothetical protein
VSKTSTEAGGRREMIMLAASRWRVRPQRLDGKEDDMTRIMIFFLHEGLLKMLVLPLRVKKGPQRLQGEDRKTKKKTVGL